MLGGLTMFSLVSVGVPYWLSFIATILFVTLIGWLMEFLLIRRAKGADAISLIILTIGTSIFIRGISSMVWGKDQHTVAPFTENTPVTIGGASITPQSIWVVLIMLLVVGLMYMFIDKTMLGKAFQASSVNPMAARLMGISPKRMSSFSFVLSAALGAIAGLAIAPIIFPAYDMGAMLGIKGFSAAILGGLGSAPGAVIGGLLIGLFESMGAGYVSSGMKDIITFSIFLLILIIRPNGILGEKTIGKGGL